MIRVCHKKSRPYASLSNASLVNRHINSDIPKLIIVKEKRKVIVFIKPFIILQRQKMIREIKKYKYNIKSPSLIYISK
jgi:hypothetical protein